MFFGDPFGACPTKIDPKAFALPRGGDQGEVVGPTRAQSGRSVEVERPFWDVDVSLLRASMITLNDPYRSLASQGGEKTRVFRGADSCSKWSFC